MENFSYQKGILHSSCIYKHNFFRLKEIISRNQKFCDEFYWYNSKANVKNPISVCSVLLVVWSVQKCSLSPPACSVIGFKTCSTEIHSLQSLFPSGNRFRSYSYARRVFVGGVYSSNVTKTSFVYENQLIHDTACSRIFIVRHRVPSKLWYSIVGVTDWRTGVCVRTEDNVFNAPLKS